LKNNLQGTLRETLLFQKLVTKLLITLARSGAAKPPPFFATPLPAPVTGQTLGFYFWPTLAKKFFQRKRKDKFKTWCNINFLTKICHKIRYYKNNISAEDN